MRGGWTGGYVGLFEVVVGFGWGLGDHVVEIRVKLHGYDASDVVMKS